MKRISSLIKTTQGLTAWLLAAIAGCHSTQLKGPAGGTNIALNTSWAQDYKQARAASADNPELACKLWTRLSREEKFPPHELAALRRLEVCNDQNSSLPNPKSAPPWLREIALDIALKQSATTGDKVAEMEFAIEKSRRNLLQSEKVRWIQLAIARADELGQTDKADEYKKRLYSVAPRLNPEPKAREFLDVANDLRSAREFEKAREFYEKVIRDAKFSVDDRIKSLKGLRLAYKNERRMDSHIESSKRLVDFLGQMRKENPRSQFLRQAHYDAEVFFGRAVWTAHRRTEALQVFDRLEKTMKGRVSLAETYWIKARIAEEEGDFETVGRYLDLALKQKIRDADMHDKIFWYSAWNERRRKNPAHAAEILAELVESTQSDFTRVRALFWLGKTYQDLERADDAKASFERLMALDPVGYYGLLAHRTMGQTISFKFSSAREESNVPLDTTLAEWLSLLEEKIALTALLDQAAKEYRKRGDQTDEGWITLFQYYAKGGLYTKLFESLGALTPERRTSVLERHPDLLFPQPWSNEVRTAALQFGVDEELIYAIIRQESSFDPKARSGADAFGLMQVLPEVAEATGHENNIAYAGMDDLYDPKTNVLIGAAHLRELLKRHKGQFIPAVASYNANENAIRNWIKTRFRGDSLEFIEEIPYEETRTYVRLVMRNLIFYSLLKSKNAAIEFPAWVLKLEDAS